MEVFEKGNQHRGSDATFLVHVQHRRHASWQGEVTWVDERKKEYFRSVWELVKLMEGALDEGGTDSERQQKC